jgi:hypothetical protein
VDDVCRSVGDGVTTGAEWMTSVALVLSIAKKMATVQYVYISKLRECSSQLTVWLTGNW